MGSSLCHRTITVEQEQVKVPLSIAKATEARDALAKTLYDNLFKWLVKAINDKVDISASASSAKSAAADAAGAGEGDDGESKVAVSHPPPAASFSSSSTIGGRSGSRSIGILDIFGFEILANNTFEQLCINYVNEKLQQLYNKHVFKEETDLYDREQIDFPPFNFTDNQRVIDLLEKRPAGMFLMLDEEGYVPRGGDQKFLRKLTGRHAAASGLFQASRFKPTEFVVSHFAAKVTYSCVGMVEKNKDVLNLNLVQVLEAITLPLLKTILVPPKPAELAGGGDDANSRNSLPPGGRPAASTRGSKRNTYTSAGSRRLQTSRRPPSLSGQLRQGMTQLLIKLGKTAPHFIRCVKPNENRAAGEIDLPMVLEQLKCLGIVESLQIQRQGFPFRKTYAAFLLRYRAIAPSFYGPGVEASKELCEQFLRAVEERTTPHVDVLGLDCFRLGLTMCFYRAPQHLALEEQLGVRLNAAITAIAAVVRGCLHGRRVARRLREARRKVGAAVQARELEGLRVAVLDAGPLAEKWGSWLELKEAESLLHVLEEEMRITAVVGPILDLPVPQCDKKEASLAEAVKAADKIHMSTDVATRGRVLLVEMRERSLIRRKLREATVNSDARLLAEMLERAENALGRHGSFCARELEKARVELDQIDKEQDSLDTLGAALACGGAQGSLGTLDGSDADTSQLKAAVEMAVRVDVKTNRGRTLLSAARTLVVLREGLKARDWEAIGAHMRDRTAIAWIPKRKDGRIRGASTILAPSPQRESQLDYNDGEPLEGKGGGGGGGGGEDEDEDDFVPDSLPAGLGAAHDEVRRINNELTNRRWIKKLGAALRKGPAMLMKRQGARMQLVSRPSSSDGMYANDGGDTGEDGDDDAGGGGGADTHLSHKPGLIDMETIDLAELGAAVQQAASACDGVHCPMGDTLKSRLEMSRIVLSLRHALVDGELVAVDDALAALDKIGHLGLPEVTIGEIQAAEEELTYVEEPPIRYNVQCSALTCTQRNTTSHLAETLRYSDTETLETLRP